MIIDDLLDRLKREFIKVNMLQASLDALLFFLTANLVLFVTGITITGTYKNYVVLAFVASVFFLGDLLYRAYNYRLEVYEEQNPELREILRTARDNRERQDVVTWRLFQDLLDRTQEVPSDSIIPSKEIMQKIVVVGILSLLTMFSGLLDVRLHNTAQLFPDITPPGLDAGDDGNNESFKLQETDSIYGDAEEIDAADMDLSFNITGGGPSRDQGGGQDRTVDPPDHALGISGSQLQEDLALAKRYSLAIKAFPN